jgi:hypothetical protein
MYKMEINEIKKLIKEAFLKLFNEAEESAHAEDRFEDRFKLTGIFSTKEMNNIYNNIKIIEDKKLPAHLTFAIKLAQLDVDKNSVYAIKEGDNYYYSVKVSGDTKPSVGDEVWAIIRGGKVITIMLRKHTQGTSGMDVDYIWKTIKQLEDFKWHGGKQNKKPTRIHESDY